MIFESGDHGHGLVVIVGRSNAIQTGLTGDDLEEDPTIVAATVGGDDLDVLDGKRGKPGGFPGDLLRGGGGNQGQRDNCPLEEFSAIHRGVSPCWWCSSTIEHFCGCGGCGWDFLSRLVVAF
jgi:hypothetical protein